MTEYIFLEIEDDVIACNVISKELSFVSTDGTSPLTDMFVCAVEVPQHYYGKTRIVKVVALRCNIHTDRDWN